MSDGQEVITKLEKDSTWFKTLKPQEKLYVAYVCTNGGSALKAAKKAGRKSVGALASSEAIMEAKKEFMTAVLADRVSELESKITHVLWTRAFYNPFDLIDEMGQPLTADGFPYDSDTFSLKEYKERIGDLAVCIEGVKRLINPKSPDMIIITLELADRRQALKELTNYIGMSHEDTAEKGSSFVVNVTVDTEHVKKEAYKIAEYKPDPKVKVL